MVYRGVMGRTNIEIDDDLIDRVMRRYQLPSKRAAVELALRRLAGEPMSRDEALAMEGTGWSGDLEAMREADATAWPTDATAGS
jgi:Arc/MetJ family transcription regulator